MLISFDFDDTLDRKDAQIIAQQLIDNGHEVIIVTSRYTDEKAMEKHGQGGHGWNYDLREVADHLGIDRRYWTNMNFKACRLDRLNVDIHIDDNRDEIYEIEEYAKNCIGILIKNKKDKDWISELYKAMRRIEDEQES